MATAQPTDNKRVGVIVVMGLGSFNSANFTREAGKRSILQGLVNFGMSACGSRVSSFPLSDGGSVACETAENCGISSFRFHLGRKVWLRRVPICGMMPHVSFPGEAASAFIGCAAFLCLCLRLVASFQRGDAIRWRVSHAAMAQPDAWQNPCLREVPDVAT